MTGTSVPGSFRDPAGFVFRRDGVLYRQVNACFEAEWSAIRSSGLLSEWANAGMMVAHQELPLEHSASEDAIAVLKPQEIPFISYPYEWAFSQLREAALLTLDLMAQALERGFWLRDASAYNVQFNQGRPLLVDTLSLAPYAEGNPWPAYGQFCRHFLAPLALMSRVDLRLGLLLRDHLDGVPLDLASKLLPLSTRLGLGLGVHLHLHARSTRSESPHPGPVKVSKQALLGMVSGLASTVRSLRAPADQTTWKDYYDHTNYSREAFESKKTLVAQFLGDRRRTVIWDLGANTGVFSELAADVADLVVALDLDPQAVETAWQRGRAEGRTNVLPLLMDFANPSPSLGWAHQERESLVARGPADTVLALALVHHLAIGNNVPLPRVFDWLASLAKEVIVEFVPKEDSQVQRMLRTRSDVFPHYTKEGFESAASSRFVIAEQAPIVGSVRTLYRLEAR